MRPVRRLLFPLSPLLLGTSGLAVFLAAVMSSREVTSGLAVVWVTVSASVREGLFLAGPIAGLTALVVGTRFNSARALILPVSGVRAGAASVRRHVGVIFSVTAAAYTLGQIVGLAGALPRATYGGPDLLVIASAYPVLGTYIAVGYLVGTLLPDWRGRLGGTLTLGLMSIIGSLFGSRWWAVAPVWTYGLTRAGYHDNVSLTVFRILFFSTVVLSAGKVCAIWVARRSLATTRRPIGSLLFLSPVLLGAALAGVQQPAIQYRDASPPRLCQSVSEVSVCVHPAHSDLLGELANVSSAAIDAAGPSFAHSLDEILDESLGVRSDLNSVSVGLHLSSREELREMAALDIARWLARVDSCPSTSTVGVAEKINRGLQLWIYRQATVGAGDEGYFSPGTTGDVADALDTIDKYERERWIAEHMDAIESCNMRVTDVP